MDMSTLEHHLRSMPDRDLRSFALQAQEDADAESEREEPSSAVVGFWSAVVDLALGILAERNLAARILPLTVEGREQWWSGDL